MSIAFAAPIWYNVYITLVVCEKYIQITKKESQQWTKQSLRDYCSQPRFYLCRAGGGNDPSVETTTSGSDETTAPEEITRENYPDSLGDVRFEGRTITIAYTAGDDTINYEVVGDDTGDIVSDAIYARNRYVEERLGVKIEFAPGTANVNKFMKDVRTVLTAGDDAYSIVVNSQYEMMPMALEGFFHDLSDAKYLDYSKPWWATSYMEEVEWGGERYCLMGDISTIMLRSMSSVFMNKRVFENAFGSVDDFYDIILDGKWTYDVMNKYVEDAFQDLDANGSANAGDILGLATTQSAPTEHFAFSAGLRLSERSKDGKIQLVSDQSRNVKIFEEMYKLFYNNPGSCVWTDPFAIDKEILQEFKNGNVLFYPIRTYAADNIRDMTDPFGVIPFPKLDEDQENYMALIHDGAHMFAIPLTRDDIDAECAVLEAMCAENYRKVTPAYYETTLKVKYTHDDASAKLIDIIHDNVRTDFIYANNYGIGSGGNLGTISRTLMNKKSSDYMSLYASLKPQIEESLKTLNEKVK